MPFFSDIHRKAEYKGDCVDIIYIAFIYNVPYVKGT